MREIEASVTDEAVQQTHDQIAAQTEEELPPSEDVRRQLLLTGAFRPGGVRHGH